MQSVVNSRVPTPPNKFQVVRSGDKHYEIIFNRFSARMIEQQLSNLSPAGGFFSIQLSHRLFKEILFGQYLDFRKFYGGVNNYKHCIEHGLPILE